MPPRKKTASPFFAPEDVPSKKTLRSTKKQAEETPSPAPPEPKGYVDQAAFHPLPSPLGLLVIGDPHVRVSNPTQEEEMFEATLTLARLHKPDAIIVLGDVFDTHSRLDLFPTHAATKWLRQLSLLSPRLIILPGNHDMMSDNAFLTEVHPFTAMKYWEHVSVPDQGEVLEIKGFRFVCLPYVYRGRFEEALAHVCTRFISPALTGTLTPDVAIRDVLEETVGVIAHQEWRGCKLGAMISEKGDAWSLDRPVVVSGHIHEHGWVQPNICYTGTPIQHSAADKDVKTVSWFRVVPWGEEEKSVVVVVVNEPGQCPLRRHSPWTLAEQRIRLDVKRRIQLKCTAAAFPTVDPGIDPLTCYFEWRVEGTLAELVALKKTPKWKQWAPYLQTVRKRDDPVLQTLPSDGVVGGKVGTVKTAFSDTRPFMTVLYEEAGCVPELKAVYRTIFGETP